MPSVCLPVGDLEMAHCCMPYALSQSGQDSWSLTIGGERAKILKVLLSSSEQKWSAQFGLTVYESEKGRENGCVKAHCSFSFPIVKYICLQPLFGRLTKQLDNWRHVFFMWESASVICRGKNAIFYPPLLFMGSKCQKLLQSAKWNW